MRQVLAATEALKQTRNGYLGRALETAIVVCYARAFAGGNEIGTLGDSSAPTDPEMRRYHDELLRLRDQVYAHTDRRGGARDVEDVGALVGLDKVAYTESFRPFKPTALAAIVTLAKQQEERFREDVQKLEDRLNDKATRST